MEIKMTKVESSCIESVGFDEENNELYVEFTTGRTYKYLNCSKTLYENFMNSSSKGRFLNDYFVGTNCQRLS
jgi:hypothetical protein